MSPNSKKSSAAVKFVKVSKFNFEFQAEENNAPLFEDFLVVGIDKEDLKQYVQNNPE